MLNSLQTVLQNINVSIVHEHACLTVHIVTNHASFWFSMNSKSNAL